MAKKSKKGVFALLTIAAVAGGAYAWYKTKKKKVEEDEFSDIFDEEDFESDEA